jgi:hypothetical protein
VSTLKKLNINSPDELDLSAEPETSLALDRRAELYLQCDEVGWFKVASADGARPLAIDRSYYARLCADVFSFAAPPRTDTFNREFGGRTPILTSAVWSSGADDTWAAVAVPGTTVAGGVNESIFVSLENGRDADILSLGRDEIQAVRKEKIVRIIREWVTFSCSNCNASHGECYLHRCVCENDWGNPESGERCSERQVMYRDMLVLEVLATITPTGLVLAIGFVTWYVLIRSKSTASPDGSNATNRGRYSGGRSPTIQI